MTPEIREHICELLTEAVQILDDEGSAMVAIHVTQAMDALGCGVSDAVRGATAG